MDEQQLTQVSLVSEPAVSYPIREVLSRIEQKIDRMGDQIHGIEIDGSKTAREALQDAHDLELRVERLELGQASAASVRSATLKARQAMWTAIGAIGAAAGAIVLLFINAH